MQIVIDIPEGRFRDIQRIASVQLKGRFPTVEQIIASGTPLPKGHGRLIDGDALFFCMTNGVDQAIAEEARDDAPTIIEADKGGGVSNEIHRGGWRTMGEKERRRIENAIRHIKTAVDVEPWADYFFAIRAMKRDLPQKPTEEVDKYNENLFHLYCPNCKECIGMGNKRLKRFDMHNNANRHICGICGQVLDLEVLEDEERRIDQQEGGT